MQIRDDNQMLHRLDAKRQKMLEMSFEFGFLSNSFSELVLGLGV